MISVCIPVYNVEAYLKECLDSVDASIAAYHGPVDYEILLVDDASTDSSGRIASEYVKAHAKARMVTHAQNKGLAEARNTLLANATGDYIAWVDSDDRVSADWFSTLACILEKAQPDIVAFELQNETDGILDAGSSFGERSFGCRPGSVEDVDGREYAQKVLQGLTIFDYSPTRIVRRELHDGLSYRAPRGVYEDTIFAFDFLPRAKTVVYCAKPLYIYRQRGDSIMHTRKVENWLKEIEVMRETIADMESPYKEAATVHLMTDMRRVMLLAIKNPSDSVLRTKSMQFKRYYRSQIGLVLFGAYLPIRRRIADLLTMIPFSDVILRRLA